LTELVIATLVLLALDFEEQGGRQRLLRSRPSAR